MRGLEVQAGVDGDRGAARWLAKDRGAGRSHAGLSRGRWVWCGAVRRDTEGKARGCPAGNAPCGGQNRALGDDGDRRRAGQEEERTQHHHFEAELKAEVRSLRRRIFGFAVRKKIRNCNLDLQKIPRTFSEHSNHNGACHDQRNDPPSTPRCRCNAGHSAPPSGISPAPAAPMRGVDKARGEKNAKQAPGDQWNGDTRS